VAKNAMMKPVSPLSIAFLDSRFGIPPQATNAMFFSHGRAKNFYLSGWIGIFTGDAPKPFSQKGRYGVGLASSRGCSGNGLSYVQGYGTQPFIEKGEGMAGPASIFALEG
jgi:hypothetical protein